MELSNARINRFSDGFFPSASRFWNSFPSSVFSASFNLPSLLQPSFLPSTFLPSKGPDGMIFFYCHFRYFINLFYPLVPYPHTYIALYNLHAKVTYNTHTHTHTQNKKLLTIPLKLLPSLANYPPLLSPLPLGGSPPLTQN